MHMLTPLPSLQCNYKVSNLFSPFLYINIYVFIYIYMMCREMKGKANKSGIAPNKK